MIGKQYFFMIGKQFFFMIGDGGWDLKRIFEGVLSLVPTPPHLQQVLGVEHGQVSAWKFS